MIKEIKIAGMNAVVYLPTAITGKLPVLFFLPGKGEQTGTMADIYKHGPLSFIKKGWNPDFIIIGFQTQQEWPNAIRVKQFLDAAKLPEIDTGRIALTGLSAGAGGIFNLFKSNPDYGISAIIPMSMTSDPIEPGNFSKTRVWGLCGKGDSRYLKMKEEILSIPGARFTDIPTTVSHGDWNKVYNPEWKFNGESIYDWAFGGAVGTEIFYNKEISKDFYRNDCANGWTTEPVTYTVPAKTWSGNTQAIADTLAETDMRINGQVNANKNGVCTAPPKKLTATILVYDDGSIEVK